jgi:N-acetyltransferase
VNVEPVSLAGPTIRLDPTVPEHAPLLWPQAGPEIFRHFLEWPRDASLEAFQDWVREALTRPAALLYSIFLHESGEAVGMTGYLEIRPAHRGLEIGRTWFGKSFQGTRVNPESKYLLLAHAFEQLGAARVQLKTDLNNLHSQRAIEKLGAQREGVLRRYQMRSNGTLRDTVIYSILADEWPQVKAKLQARLAVLESKG